MNYSIQNTYDSMREEVNDYIQGKKSWRGENHVRTLMMMVIEFGCSIHQKGIEVGQIDFTRYKKEIKSRKKWWDRVRRGDATDSRTGFEKERAGLFRVGERW